MTKIAKKFGVLVLIDGAHVPGQLELKIDSIGCDFYTGNLHKWVFAPKGMQSHLFLMINFHVCIGCAFLWV